MGGLQTAKENNAMAIIGTFTREHTGFTGIIRTLTFSASVSIEPVAERRGEKPPAKSALPGNAPATARTLSPSVSMIRASRPPSIAAW